jgi:hypothetical protein
MKKVVFRGERLACREEKRRGRGGVEEWMESTTDRRKE